MIKRGDEEKKANERLPKTKDDGVDGGSQSGSSQQMDKSADPNKQPDVEQGISGAKKSDDPKKEKSENSQMTSSFVDSSDDTEAKRIAAEKEAKAKKRGFTKEELEATIDVELAETSTITLLHIPGTYVKQDTP